VGKHNAKTGTGRDRSRNRRRPEDIREDHAKPMRRALKRLRGRQKDFDEVMSKSPRARGFTRPGSMKTRTN